MDTERSRRHASKLLTYPMTVGSVLHQNSGLTLNNQRVTPEGIRSLAGQPSSHFVSPNYHTYSFNYCSPPNDPSRASRLSRNGRGHHP
jgi:hypothetical protein